MALPVPAVCRFEDSLAVSRLNLNNESGIMLAGPPDFGDADLERETLHAFPYDGELQVATRRPDRTVTLFLSFQPQATTAALKVLNDALFVELDRATNILRYQPVDWPSAYLIDTKRATVPSLLNGQWPNPAFWKRKMRFEVALTCHPTFRGAGAHL